MFSRIATTIVAIAAMLAAAVVWAQGPYAGQQARAIRALSTEEAAGLIDGRGMGFAKAAELNSYPGPMHLMELAKDLRLSESDVAKIRAVHDPMRAEARAIGREIVDAEEHLDRLFASGHADREKVSAFTAKIGALQGKLRAVHLNAHLAVRPLLTAEIVARYDVLRGYAGGGDPSHGAHHRH
ncbi:MAG: periplasmic heavy metal sensor [Alphaproteobacteria bacterium]|nr:periplasmic heavy metal sensor [Alphaproteobacteria bacterium]